MADAEPGMPGNPVTLTDPQMMRALAHPARIAIWAHLALHGPATATACAEVAGLSPSACSYHLRTLARYQIVEEDPENAADGRQRPWRVRVISFSIEPNSGDPARDLAGRVLVDAIRSEDDQWRRRYEGRQQEYPVEWQNHLGYHADIAHVTPAELAELKARLNAVMEEYRRLDPATRPAGTLPVRMTFDAYPLFEPEETQ
jgi:DNA-binding transcriptional ArsR family regulator